MLYHCPFTTSGSVHSCPLCYSTIEALMKSILRPFTNYLRWLENYLFMLSCKQKIHKASLFHSQRFLFPINFIKHSCFLRMFVVMIGYYSHTTKQFSVFICVVHTYTMIPRIKLFNMIGKSRVNICSHIAQYMHDKNSVFHKL